MNGLIPVIGKNNSVELFKAINPNFSKVMNFHELKLARYLAMLPPKLILTMKLTIVLLIAALVQVSGKSFGQNINLNAKNVPVEQVFESIKKQTGYVFFYDSRLVQGLQISIRVKNASINEVLENYFNDLPLTFNIIDKKNIVVRQKSESVLQRVLDVLTPSYTVSGKITDENNAPLAGVTVRIKGTYYVAIADRDGYYRMTTEKGSTLVFSIIGYEDYELKVLKTATVNIVLKAKVSALNDVVVTGYTQRKASELTGAVQSIKGDELRNGVSTTNTLAMLKGKAAGLYIVEQGGSVATRGQVVLHGQSSFNDASNTNYGPLIVLDGVITNAANLQDIVDANDIESINMLRDAASTAIYGSRAAQGVIVIVTKRGQPGKVSVNLSMNYGKVQNNRAVSFMNTQEATTHIKTYMQALYNGTTSLQTQYGSFNTYFNTTRVFTDADLNTDTQWDNEAFFTDGHQSGINLSLAGGSDKTRFYTAVNWNRQDGTLLDDNLNRKAFRFNVDQKINDKFSVSINTNALIDRYTSTNSETQYYLFEPWVSPNYANGALADSIPNYLYKATGVRGTQYYDNPLYSHTYNTNITNRINLLGSGVLKYKVFPWLSLQSTNSINYTDNSLNSYKDPRTYRGRNDGAASNRVYVNGELLLNDTKSTYFLTSNLINFNKSFGEHALSAIIGQEYGRTHSENVTVSAYNTPYPGERNLGAFLNYGTYLNKLRGTPVTPSSTAPVDKASFSLFSEINDSYKGRYFGSGSIRRDASTNFGQSKRYGTFYALSAGWLISEEEFLKQVKPISQLKLRASYGTSGREAGADYLNFSTYSDAVFYNTNSTSGSTIKQLGNPDITWETTYTTNIGIDLGLWNRISLSVDWYNKDSKNLLQNVTLPSYVGFTSQYRNVGELRNRGLDLQLNTENIKSKDFSWTMSFNISFNKNKLISIKGDSLIDGYTNSYYRYVGDDINVLKAIKYVGVNPANGRPQFEKIMPDGTRQIVDSIALAKQGGLKEYQNIGSATPKFFGGWTNTFRYRGIELSVLLNFSYGNKIMNNAVRSFVSPSAWQSGFNIPEPNNSIRFWQGPGDTKANYPNFYDLAFDQRGALNVNSSLLYVDASYIRMRNVRLGYDLPKSLLSRLHISSINIYVSADNVFVIKSKDLYAADPEGATIGGTSNTYAGTGVASAMPRRFLVGFTAGF
jgi:TonB-linked SusC/RagA family outer membrane protein